MFFHFFTTSLTRLMHMLERLRQTEITVVRSAAHGLLNIGHCSLASSMTEAAGHRVHSDGSSPLRQSTSNHKERGALAAQ
jgi:hypothetical protein